MRLRPGGVAEGVGVRALGSWLDVLVRAQGWVGGPGLAFVHAVATAHGGTAHAGNTGHGTAVTLDLPC